MSLSNVNAFKRLNPLPDKVPIVKNLHTINLQWKNTEKNTCGGVSFLVKFPVKDH